MRSLRPFGWRWQWALVLLIVGFCFLAMAEPESAEFARSMVDVTAMLGIGWLVWYLMNYE